MIHIFLLLLFFNIFKNSDVFLHHYFLSNIVFTTPLSIIVSNIFFNIIKIIGPIIIPIIPIILKPVYIAIDVNIGCIPIWLLTILGSINCLITIIIIYKTINDIASVISPLKADITAQGNIMVPAPNIGSASTKPINKAITNGYFIFIPIKSNTVKPISNIIKDINIKTTSAFK